MRNTFVGINATHSGRKLAICGISNGIALDGLLGSSRKDDRRRVELAGCVARYV